MTKSQLIDRIAAKVADLPRREVEAIVCAIFEAMAEALREGQRIEIRGFGSFCVKARAARQGRNPRTGERVNVPLRHTVSFTIGKELKERLNPTSPAALPAYSGATLAQQPEAMVAAPASGGRLTLT
ncbi:MAG: integration host factor subunit beta [Myxococcales bacterium]|nr:integration host factor subunit beta [Myxococcales bacterium]